MQKKSEVTPPITQAVVDVVSRMDEAATAVDEELHALTTYVQHIFIMQDVVKARKQWEDNRQKKVSAAIAKAMKDWDDEHYPRLLQATWGWHPFYSSFLANPVCVKFIPTYPLSHSAVEGWDASEVVLQQTQVKRVYPVPWSVLLLRCFLKYHILEPPILLHPQTGLIGANIAEWLRVAKESVGEGWRTWQRAISHLKGEGFLLYAGARPVDSQHQWVAGVEDAWRDLRNPSRQWWAELRHWCNTTQFRAIQDMAKHDKQTWIRAWVIRDPPSAPAPPLARYERWLQFREDIDIGYILAQPGKHCGLLVVTCCISRNKSMEGRL